MDSNDISGDLTKSADLLNMFLGNKMDEVITYLEQHSKENFYIAFGKAIVHSAEAGIAFNQLKIEKALKSIKESLKSSSSRRKPGISKHFYVSDYNDFTDEQCHAELCYAEALICYGLFVVVYEPGLVGFLNAAADVKISHECYKLCTRILDHKTQWNCDDNRLQFEAGVRLGIAAFELGCSFLPSKFRRLLPVIGFSGNRELALTMLTNAGHLKGTMRFKAMQAMLFAYSVGFEHLFCLGESDMNIVADIVDNWEPKSDDFLVFNAFQAVYNHRMGNMKQAIELYELCVIKTTKMFPRLHPILRLAIALCHSANGEWALCTQNMESYKDEFRWSPALYAYFYAVCLFMRMEQEDDDRYVPEIQEYLKKAPKLKQKFGGHLAFHEKLVMKRSEMYSDNVKAMILPIYELFYIWNYFPFIANCENSLKKIMLQIERKTRLVTMEANFDGLMYLTFLKGVVYKFQNLKMEAMKCFEFVLKRLASHRQTEKSMKNEKHLQPQAALEMAIMHKNDANYERAKRYLKKAKHYNNYLTEVMVKYRINCVYASMKTISS